MSDESFLPRSSYTEDRDIDPAWRVYMEAREFFTMQYQDAIAPLYAEYKKKCHLAWLVYLADRSKEPKPAAYICAHCRHDEATTDAHVAVDHVCKRCGWVTTHLGEAIGPDNASLPEEIFNHFDPVKP